jgi:hypothetical protein
MQQNDDSVIPAIPKHRKPTFLILPNTSKTSV